MGYLIFRGVSTESLSNVAVARMPSHKKASQRFTMYYVKGRDGALHVAEGMRNFDLTVTLVLLDASATTRQIVNAWADGTGMLVLSDDLTKAYKATVEEEIEWSRIQGNSGYFDTAEITFNCQPYMYEASESSYEFLASGTLENQTSATALPTIVVEGVGTCVFSVAGEEITIDGMTSGVPVTIDCENGYVYTASGAMTMTGNFPELQIGLNNIVLTSGVTRLLITPHWRWV